MRCDIIDGLKIVGVSRATPVRSFGQTGQTKLTSSNGNTIIANVDAGAQVAFSPTVFGQIIDRDGWRERSQS